MKTEQKDLFNYLFLTIFIFLGIGPSSFTSRAGQFDSDAGSSNIIYNIIFLSITITCCYVLVNFRKPVLKTLLNPLIFLHLIWMYICMFIAGDFFIILKKLILISFAFSIFAIAPLLPENQKKTGELLGVFCITILTLCYLGVALLPSVAIHQASDATEAVLAGDWRGLFIHKNTAGFNMALIAITGIYIVATGNKFRGFLIFIFAIVFLIFAGSKSGMALIVPCILMGYIIKIQKNNFLNLLVILATPAAIHSFTLGSLFFPPIKEALAATGVDTTFTGRTDIWEYVIEQINRFPLFGNGFGSHWGLPEVKFNEEAFSWVGAIGSAHNGFLEISLSNGIPMIFFFLLFALVLPLRSYFKAVKLNGHSPLLTYFLQIWMYVICASGTESIFYGTGTGWGMFTFSVFGLYYFSKFKSI